MSSVEGKEGTARVAENLRTIQSLYSQLSPSQPHTASQDRQRHKSPGGSVEDELNNEPHSTSDEEDGTPQVARAVKGVSAAVRAAWQRMGLSSPQRRSRWRSFVSGSLLPFLQDFQSRGEGEERAAAADNDALLREVLFLCMRLEEAPRAPALVPVVAALQEARAKNTANASPESLTLVKDGEDSFLLGGVGGGGAGAGPRLPSFALLTEHSQRRTASLGCKRPRDEAEEDASRDLDKGQQKADDGEESLLLSGPVAAALESLSASHSHTGIHALLTEEAERLRRLAATRVFFLTLLAKQQALLARTPAEQCRARKACAERYLSRPLEIAPLAATHEERKGGNEEEDRGGEEEERRPNAATTAVDSVTVGDEAASLTEEEQELMLLMAAPSLNFDVSGCALDVRGTLGASFQPRHTFLLRPTAAPSDPHNGSNTGNPGGCGLHSDSKNTESDGIPRDSLDEEEAVRAIQQRGARQDLSLRRILAEALRIRGAIEEQNREMETALATEQRHLHTLYEQYNKDEGEGEERDVLERTQEMRTHYYKELQEAELCATGRPSPSPSADVAVTTDSSAAAGATAPSTVTVPQCVRELLTMPSLSPVLGYAQEARQLRQRRILTQYAGAVDAVLAEVSASLVAFDELYKAPSAARARRGDWVEAVLEGGLAWLSETQRVQHLPSYKASLREWLDSPLDTDDCGMQSLASRVQLVSAVLQGCTAFLHSTRARLALLRTAQPLCEAASEIQREQAELQEGSRERLLSKKINMAKQLMHEERVRRRLAKELPRIQAQLLEALAAWESLPLDPLLLRCLDTDGAALSLCVHGVRVTAESVAALTGGGGGGGRAAGSSRSPRPVAAPSRSLTPPKPSSQSQAPLRRGERSATPPANSGSRGLTARSVNTAGTTTTTGGAAKAAAVKRSVSLTRSAVPQSASASMSKSRSVSPSVFDRLSRK